jgi:Protein of unknown function (DUF1488)
MPTSSSVAAASARPPSVKPAAPKWDGTRVLFQVIDDGEAVSCAISREALRQVTGRNYGKPAELLASFMQVRGRIEAVALAKHRAQSSGTALLTVWSGDLDDHEAEDAPSEG